MLLRRPNNVKPWRRLIDNSPCQHTLSTHYEKHPLTPPLKPPSQFTLSTHPLNPPAQPTLTTYSRNSPSQPALSNHPFKASHRYIHSINPPSQPTLSHRSNKTLKMPPSNTPPPLYYHSLHPLNPPSHPTLSPQEQQDAENASDAILKKIKPEVKAGFLSHDVSN